MRTTFPVWMAEEEVQLLHGHLPYEALIVDDARNAHAAFRVLRDVVVDANDGDLRRHIDGLMDHVAGDVMTRDPRTVSPDTLAAEALKMMEGRITVLFVVDQGRPVGILHVHDLLRAGVI